MKKTTVYQFLFIMYLYPLLFDYKGEEDGGGFLHFLMLSISLVGFLLIVSLSLSQRRVNEIPKQVVFFINAWFLYILFTFFSSILNDVPLSQYVRVVVPFILFGFSMVTASLLYSIGLKFKDIFFIIVVAVVISCLWTPFYYIVINLMPIELLRHQIVGPLFPALFAISLSLIVSDENRKTMGLFFAVFALFVLAISITRNYMLSPLVLFLFLFFAVGGKDRIIISRVVSASKLLLLAIFVFIPIILIIKPETFEFWNYRLFGLTEEFGFDPTTYTRLAEYSAQLEILLENPWKFLTGAGMGSEYYWDPAFFSELSQILPLWYLEDMRPWVAGHSTWIYSIYSSGVIMGLLLAVLYFKSIAHSFLSIRSGTSHRTKEDFLICTMLVAFFPMTVIANPFGSRIGALFLGLFLVMPYFNSRNRG